MKFETEKYKEQALVLLMLEKQEEFLEDSSKTFLEGIKFGWLGTEVLTTYRYNKVKNSKTDKLSKEQNFILEKSLEFIADLKIPKEWFDSEWLEDNYLQILKQYETKGL
jgi:hypothetical protein